MSEWTERSEAPEGYVEHNGDLAALIPSYDSKEAVPDVDLAEQTGTNETGLVLIDGELHYITEE